MFIYSHIRTYRSNKSNKFLLLLHLIFFIYVLLILSYQAFNSSDEEWSTHKKMIDLTLKRPLAHAVPGHWEYLAVEWGSGSDGQTDVIGAAHAVENATKIAPDFCLDVVAGMLDVVSTCVGICVDVRMYMRGLHLQILMYIMLELSCCLMCSCLKILPSSVPAHLIAFFSFHSINSSSFLISFFHHASLSTPLLTSPSTPHLSSSLFFIIPHYRLLFSLLYLLLLPLSCYLLLFSLRHNVGHKDRKKKQRKI
jgi:Protein similar to CwfJ C-terminus 2